VNRAHLAALLVLIAFSACGKVGNPLPPIKRTPAAVNNLRVTQNANQVILSWTNPAQYVDTNAATDLSEVRILRNGIPVARVPVNAAGQPQSYSLPVTGSLDAELFFRVIVATKRGITSALSNAVGVTPREAPGPPRFTRVVFDQLRITLEWQPPELRPEIVAGYRVQRSDWPAPQDVPATSFEDSEYEQDKTYTYTVTAVRADGEARVPGPPSEPGTVTTTDKTPPATPTGLRVEPGDMGGALLQWTANTERDLREYLIFRSDKPETEPYRTRAELWTDLDYRQGMSYRIEAVDLFGNRSTPTMPLAGP
jgi:hypothetical protein